MKRFFAVLMLFVVLLSGCTTETVPPPSQTIATVAENEIMRAMSYNVYYQDITDTRAERVFSMIIKHQPDTLGVQEATGIWMEKFGQELGDTYAFVALGRDEGDKGERNAIFYRKDMFTLLDSGTKWLSDTPDVASKYEASGCNRILTYALLERKSDGREILVVNTHLDHELESVRLKQATVLVDFISSYGDYPVILTGDFNTGPSSSVLYKFYRNGFEASYHWDEFNQIEPTYQDGTLLDYILVSGEDFEVLSHKVCTKKINGEYPSDHFPVIVDYQFKD